MVICLAVLPGLSACSQRVEYVYVTQVEVWTPPQALMQTEPAPTLPAGKVTVRQFALYAQKLRTWGERANAKLATIAAAAEGMKVQEQK